MLISDRAITNLGCRCPQCFPCASPSGSGEAPLALRYDCKAVRQPQRLRWTMPLSAQL